MCELEMDEVILPGDVPPVGLVEEPTYEPFRLAVGA
jgi:hypothetical protein